MSTATGTTAPTKGRARLVRHLMGAELRVFCRRPVMILLTLLMPAGLLVLAGYAHSLGSLEAASQTAGRNVVAVLCVTVYFVALSTVTARRHTLALKRLRTTALPSLGIVAGLLTPPTVVGVFQFAVVQIGAVAMGAAPPADPLMLVLASLTGILVAALAGLVTSAVTATPEKAQWTMMPLFVATLGAVSVLPGTGDGAGSLLVRLVPMVANGDLVTVGWRGISAEPDRIIVDAVVVVAWVGLLTVLARRTFRWERRR